MTFSSNWTRILALQQLELYTSTQNQNQSTFAVIRFDLSIPFVLNRSPPPRYLWAGRLRERKEDDVDVQTSWKKLYLWALIESDKKKLTGLVQAIELAIASRSQELLNASDHHEERGEMTAVNAALLSIKTHKLGWPAVSPRDNLS